MDITMIGLQNAGKTSLLRVLAVSPLPSSISVQPYLPNLLTLLAQGGEFTLE